jgi:predicted Fe-Mo cluster-binding NifX family protein
MNICIPVTEDKGLESPVSAHFGSAPLFMIVDTDNGSCKALSNRNLNHGHGMCQPLLSLAGERIDGVVVGGIGMGALQKLEAADVSVYWSELPTVAAAVAAFKAGTLKSATRRTACGHHGQGPHSHEHTGSDPGNSRGCNR